MPPITSHAEHGRDRRCALEPRAPPPCEQAAVPPIFYNPPHGGDVVQVAPTMLANRTRSCDTKSDTRHPDGRRSRAERG